jgi:hypothetical protein
LALSGGFPLVFSLEKSQIKMGIKSQGKSHQTEYTGEIIIFE